MPPIVIRIEVPDGFEVTVEQPSAEPSRAHEDDVGIYWRDYLSDNGRALYQAAAEIEAEHGIGYTLSHIADRMGVDYERARSYHRTSGRSARRWKDDGGGAAPIVLNDMGYSWVAEISGMRTSYRLPEGVAEKILTLS